jgi:hypothetical protein
MMPGVICPEAPTKQFSQPDLESIGRVSLGRSCTWNLPVTSGRVSWVANYRGWWHSSSISPVPPVDFDRVCRHSNTGRHCATSDEREAVGTVVMDRLNQLLPEIPRGRELLC